MADINASGAVVGFSESSSGEEVGFGPEGPIPFPVAADQEKCVLDTIPESINVEGETAGWYLTYLTRTNTCDTKITGGFVLSPDGVLTRSIRLEPS